MPLPYPPNPGIPDVSKDASKNIGVLSTQQTNNDLLDNKFSFMVKKLPGTSYRCTQANIPAQNLAVAYQQTSVNDLPLPGQKIEFGDFNMVFIVDQNLDNFSEIADWMRMLGTPLTGKSYNELAIQQLVPRKGAAGLFSDGVLTINDAQNNPNVEVTYQDMFPYHLSEIILTNDTDTPLVMTASVSFKFQWFDVKYVVRAE